VCQSINDCSIFCIVVVTSNVSASSDAPPSIDTKSVIEVNAVIEDVFLITLNKGWICSINEKFIFNYFSTVAVWPLNFSWLVSVVMCMYTVPQKTRDGV